MVSCRRHRHSLRPASLQRSHALPYQLPSDLGHPGLRIGTGRRHCEAWAASRIGPTSSQGTRRPGLTALDSNESGSAAFRSSYSVAMIVRVRASAARSSSRYDGISATTRSTIRCEVALSKPKPCAKPSPASIIFELRLHRRGLRTPRSFRHGKPRMIAVFTIVRRRRAQ